MLIPPGWVQHAYQQFWQSRCWWLWRKWCFFLINEGIEEMNIRETWGRECKVFLKSPYSVFPRLSVIHWGIGYRLMFQFVRSALVYDHNFVDYVFPSKIWPPHRFWKISKEVQCSSLGEDLSDLTPSEDLLWRWQQQLLRVSYTLLLRRLERSKMNKWP